LANGKHDMQLSLQFQDYAHLLVRTCIQRICFDCMDFMTLYKLVFNVNFSIIANLLSEIRDSKAS